MQPGITLRDLVNAIPYVAIKKGLLTVSKKGKKNVFNGRILEIEGLPNLKVEQAFELSDASAERSAAGCSIHLAKEPIIEYLKSNVVLLRWMISQGYQDARTLERRASAMEKWIANPELLAPDANSDYAEVLEIALEDIKEPILACPNDPDDVKTLSQVAGTKVDEVFIGSCMTNIGHFRAAGKMLKQVTGVLPTRLWIAPPTRMDEYQLKKEGYYNIYGTSGARTEMPGCSLCMGNQARAAPGTTVVSTSTRNFPNRLGTNTNVYLSSAELAVATAVAGKIPTPEEYMKATKNIDTMAADIYRYLNFHEIDDYIKAAKKVKP
jgi:aconitate hydratase 2/2-methylisocitrate dehydratase